MRAVAITCRTETQFCPPHYPRFERLIPYLHSIWVRGSYGSVDEGASVEAGKAFQPLEVVAITVDEALQLILISWQNS